MVYALFLRDFDLSVSIGIHDFEKKEAQRILINVALLVDRKPMDDDINSVLDYDFLREQIRHLVVDGHINLQETLCQEILNLCLGKDYVVGAFASTEKPDVYDDAGAVGCRMVELKDGTPKAYMGLLLGSA